MNGSVSDNAHDILAWELRCKLRPVNMPPEMLYKQRKVPTDARPVLGRLLVTNHVLPFNINETTVKKHHDLLQVVHLEPILIIIFCLQSIPLHHYSQKNGLAMSRGEKVMKFKNPDTTSKDMLMGVTQLSVGASGGTHGLANTGPVDTSITLRHDCDSLDC